MHKLLLVSKQLIEMEGFGVEVVWEAVDVAFSRVELALLANEKVVLVLLQRAWLGSFLQSGHSCHICSKHQFLPCNSRHASCYI